MGAFCAKCRTVVIDVIPEKAVMLEIVDRIVLLEEMLKSGEPLSDAQEKERKVLEPVAKKMRGVQANDKS